MSRWRTGIATVTDVCVCLVPCLLSAWLWFGIASAFADQNGTLVWGALAYYGPAAVLLTCYATVWVFLTFSARRGRVSFRSVGLVLAGMRVENGLQTLAGSSAHPTRLILLRVGAAVMATLSAVAAGIGTYGLGGMLFSRLG